MKTEKFKKLAANLHDKTECDGLVLKKVYRVIKYDQNTWLKPYINMDKFSEI